MILQLVRRQATYTLLLIVSNHPHSILARSSCGYHNQQSCHTNEKKAVTVSKFFKQVTRSHGSGLLGASEFCSVTMAPFRLFDADTRVSDRANAH